MNCKRVYGGIVWLFILLLFMSCGKRMNKDIQVQYKFTFPIDTVLDIKEYATTEPLGNSAIKLLKNKILIFGDYNMVDIYSYPELRFIRKQQMPHFYSENIIDEKLYVEKQGKISVYTMNGQDSLCEDTSAAFRVAMVPFSIFSLHQLDEDCYVYPDMYDFKGMHEFYIVNMKNGKTIGKGTYPEGSNRFKSLRDFKLAYAHEIALKPDKTALALSYYNLRFVRIYDNMGILKYDVFIDCPPGNYKIIPEEHSSQYVQTRAICTTDKHIYIANPEQRIEAPEPHCNILVMDWKGNLVARYRLDAFVYDFFVDETRKQIFGICARDSKVTFFSFNILN